MQVISQRALGMYHMSPPCPAAWDCQEDGKTPKKDFEEHALLDVCSDRHCEEPVMAALEGNWLTAKGARLLKRACRRSLSHHFIDMEDSADKFATDALLHGVTRTYHTDDPDDPEDKGAVDKKTTGGSEEKKEAGLLSGCFPGEATVRVATGGGCGDGCERDIAMADLRVGDLVLAERAPGELAFEPVLGFLHVVRGEQPLEFLTVVHESGQFRATSGHIVFVASASGRQDKAVSELAAGEVLLLASPGAAATSRVLSISHSATTLGTYAPLTASGTIVVDGVLASNYAQPGPGVRLPHWLAHFAALPLRAYHWALGPPRRAQEASAKPLEEQLHPFMDFVCQYTAAPLLLRAAQPALAALS